MLITLIALSPLIIFVLALLIGALLSPLTYRRKP